MGIVCKCSFSLIMTMILRVVVVMKATMMISYGVKMKPLITVRGENADNSRTATLADRHISPILSLFCC